MPLEVKDVEWTETEQHVTLKVPLKGASTKNLDIFSSSEYIKVSYPPYFYEVGLFKHIDDDASRATIINGQVLFHLEKIEKELWGQLNVSQYKDKAFMKELREIAVKNKQVKEQERAKEREKMRDQQKKFAVREQMRLDSEERKMREDLKREEMIEISQDMEQWKNQNESLESGVVAEINDNVVDVKGNDFTTDTLVVTSNEKNKHHITDSTQQKNNNLLLPTSTPSDEKLPAALPEPRQTGSIQVNFTHRPLATPARESKLPEEELWLKKVADMNKMKKVANPKDVVDMEEMNPVWLKDKGNEFFKKGNYVAAINAYTSALVLDTSIPMLYANRAACHLSLKQNRECIQDCTNALELYDPPVADNAKSRCRALTRRGTAYYHLEQYVNALRDYEGAMKLDPKNDALRADAFKIRRTLQGGDSSD